MKTLAQKIITWAARALGIAISTAFVGLYIEDHISKVKVANVSLLESIFLFLFFLLPFLIPAAVLFVAWRWEIAGGIIYLVTGGFGLLCIGLINLSTPEHAWPWTVALITAPAFVTGLLFLFSGLMNRRKKKLQGAELPAAPPSQELSEGPKKT